MQGLWSNERTLLENQKGFVVEILVLESILYHAWKAADIYCMIYFHQMLSSLHCTQ